MKYLLALGVDDFTYDTPMTISKHLNTYFKLSDFSETKKFLKFTKRRQTYEQKDN